APRCYGEVLAWKSAVATRQVEERLARDQPKLQPLFEELHLARAGLARLAASPPATAEQQKDWLKRFRDLEESKENLEAKLATACIAYRRCLQLRGAGPTEVATALPGQTVLIDFLFYVHGTPPPKGKTQWAYQRRLLAFVLAKGRKLVCVELGEADGIEKD